MIDNVNGVVFGVFIFLFLLVTVLGFAAARWRRADLDSLDEWGLGGRGFGTFIAWFLIGGDIYTAYTFIAVPATLYAGSAVGFFAVPYTIVVYPLIFLFLPRLWSVSHRHGYVTPADFVRGRYDSRGLALAVAVTGILATMPYIALQLVGIQAVVTTMGLGGSGSTFAKDVPLIIAFAVLAAYTYSSGLRAPALIAFVKDTLIYIVIVVAIIYVATKIGFGTMFDSAKAQMAKTSPVTGKPGVFITSEANYWAFGTLAFGSALALFMYPHSMTAVLSGRSRNVIRQRDVPSSVLADAGPARAARLLGDRCRYVGLRDRRNSQRPAGRPPPVRGELPELVRRRGVLGHRHRRPGAVGDHVHRSGEPLHPQHLPRLHQPACHTPPGGDRLEDRLAGGEVRRPALRPRPGQAERHQHAAARWRV